MMLFYFLIVLPFLRMMVVMVVVWLLEGAVMFNFVNDFLLPRFMFVRSLWLLLSNKFGFSDRNNQNPTAYTLKFLPLSSTHLRQGILSSYQV